MDINDIITLPNKEEYIILDKILFNKNNYLYVVQIDEEEIPINNYKYLKVIDDYIEEVSDKDLLRILENKELLNYVNEEQDA